MLGFQSYPEDSGSRMPMDFSNYLLSASPPSSAFDLLSFSSQQAFSHLRNQIPFDNSNYFAPPSFQCLQMAQSGKKTKKAGALKSIIVKPDYTYSSDSDAESGNETPTSPKRSSKKVSFADHQGFALATVRLVKERPDEPPTLNPELLSSLTIGTDADVSLNPPIRVTFTQPASDYMAFRDKLNKNMVSLENVILRDYTVEGTIKVKNIHFEKKVYVRLSLDEWITFKDTTAKYLPGPGNKYKEPFDTFSFSMEIDPSFNVKKTIQFAVCFETDGKQYWDNNGGLNYVLVSEDYESQTAPKYFDKFLPTKRKDQTWSEFSSWSGEKESPYY